MTGLTLLLSSNRKKKKVFMLLPFIISTLRTVQSVRIVHAQYAGRGLYAEKTYTVA